MSCFDEASRTSLIAKNKCAEQYVANCLHSATSGVFKLKLIKDIVDIKFAFLYVLYVAAKHACRLHGDDYLLLAWLMQGSSFSIN